MSSFAWAAHERNLHRYIRVALDSIKPSVSIALKHFTTFPTLITLASKTKTTSIYHCHKLSYGLPVWKGPCRHFQQVLCRDRSCVGAIYIFTMPKGDWISLFLIFINELMGKSLFTGGASVGEINCSCDEGCFCLSLLNGSILQVSGFNLQAQSIESKVMNTINNMW